MENSADPYHVDITLSYRFLLFYKEDMTRILTDQWFQWFSCTYSFMVTFNQILLNVFAL